MDDHTVVRGAYVDLLNQWPRGQVVLDAANGVDYELRSQETGPIDIVLMDLQMPHRDGFQTTRWIRQHQRNTRVLGLSHDPTVANARELLRLGALGLLPKNAEPAEIFQALDQAAADHIHTNDLVRDALRTPALPEEEEAERVNALPDQERHVLELWVHKAGHTIPQIAGKLGVKPSTVNTHIDRFCRKLGIKNRVDAVYLALRTGLMGRNGRRRR